MGKSLDLPDPLESTSKPLGNADDLLAQLAGEEVDRLLAEAETGDKQRAPGEARRSGDASPAPADAVPDAAPNAAPAVAPEVAVQDQLDALFNEIHAGQPLPAPASVPAPLAAAPPPPSVPAVAPIAPAPYSPITSKLPDDVDANEVMAAILGDVGMPVPAPAAATPTVDPAATAPSPAAAPSSMRAAAPKAPPPATASLAASIAQRQTLAAGADPADELPGPGELEALTGPIEADAPLPIYLKPLEWLSAPLEMVPPSVRDVIGQIAILTLINAVAVLIYVFVFRIKP